MLYVTRFKALLLYLHTGVIEFAPIGSKNKESQPNIFNTSSKSIYRLADKYDIRDLKNIAFKNIRANLACIDIVDESFSRFTSRYNQIRDAELKMLRSALLSHNSAAVISSLQTKVQSYAGGKTPHCSETFVKLFNKLLPSKSWLSNVQVSQSQSGQESHAQDGWFANKALEKSLAKWLTVGMFVDTIIYANSSRLHPHLKFPVHFSRMAVGKKLYNIKKYTTLIGVEFAKTIAICDSGSGDYESDSDLDDDELDEYKPAHNHEGATRTVASDGTTHHENSRAPEDKMLVSVDVARIGAVSTWKALMFYMYTNEVTFAPLTSQGAEERKMKLVEALSLHSHLPKPCSPKSLYSLADKLGLSSLRDLALKDVESKLNESNILTELFSKFTSLHKVVLTAETKFLLKILHDEVNAKIVRDHILSMAEGKTLHGPEALMSIFVELLENWKSRNTSTSSFQQQVYHSDTYTRSRKGRR